MKASARVADCDECSIIAQLSEEEHESAIRYENSCLLDDLFPRMLNASYDLIRNQDSEHVFIRLKNKTKQSLILDAKVSTVWHIVQQDKNDYKLVLTGEPSRIQGLHDDGYILDYSYLSEDDRSCNVSYYTRQHWDNDWFSRMKGKRGL
ncbi:hypothetical protein QDY71_05445 [Kingella negevensis]|uniref:Uncharacterized protein n=1 Tax=Kingella negevensis TaxID=1522312 RepID=A0A238HJB1_9NEIS|nr:hypothetical protein [Kingella negevensis]MDK4679363.1 hypothetical protein [Kingella negevensis]MDK4682917.1 hypothetical protein [Kingella negevensis]MDK4685637.1 hypothetical protein [Kingella negevensis]MDK4691116.1 hypothetical protein [Kingella negevensis]MDK4693737.1 hypothetical protein [Kingella negevensis]